MAILSIYVEDQQRTIEAICYAYRYQTTIDTNNEIIPNPETKEQFTNRILQTFITQHVKNYEIKLAQDAAAANINNNFTFITQDAATATPHRYYMICDAAEKTKYDNMASALKPNTEFNIALTGTGPDLTITHYGLEVDLTEAQKIQLYTLELFGGTGTGTYPTLLYVRSNSKTSIPEATNIAGFPLSGNPIIFDDVLENLQLQRSN